MPVKCSICQHPSARQIDDLLDAGESKKSVAAQFSVSIHSVSRHSRHGAAPDSDSLEAQAAKWRTRADDLWQHATADADVRGQAQAVAAGLRSCEMQARAAEKKAEVQAKSAAELDDGKISIGSLDELVSILTQENPSPVDQAKLRIALDKARALNRPDMVAIFYQAHENPRFAEALSDFAATWSEKKGTNESEPIQEASSAPN
jgi:transposase